MAIRRFPYNTVNDKYKVCVDCNSLCYVVFIFLFCIVSSLLCFDAVGWVAGRATGL